MKESVSITLPKKLKQQSMGAAASMRQSLSAWITVRLLEHFEKVKRIAK